MNFNTACRTGDLERVKYLLGEGCDPINYPSWSIIWAAEYGHLEIVKLLLSIGCDFTSAILYAYYNGHLEIVKLLVKEGCYHESVKPYVFILVREEVIKLGQILNNKYLILEIIERLPYSKRFNCSQLFSLI